MKTSLGLGSALLALALALAACGPHVMGFTDAGPDVSQDVQLPPPVLQPLAPLAPYWVASVIGTSSGAERVLISTSTNGSTATDPRMVTPGIDGRFCLDILLPGPGTYAFVAQGTSGTLLSRNSNIVMTTFSPSAPPVANAATCEDTPPANCDNTGNCCARNCTTTGHVCGSDGCGGSCGACGTGQMCNNGTCCTHTCTGGRNCGDDGCGGTCGTCSASEVCTAGHCAAATCASFDTCSPCVNAQTSPLCGWCSTTGRCLPGDGTASSDGTCTGANWHYSLTSCP